MNSVVINQSKGLYKAELFSLLVFCFFFVLSFFVFDQIQQTLIIPMMIMIMAFGILVFWLVRIEKSLPIFDAGFFMIAITFLYSFYPYLSFVMTGFEVGLGGDNRLNSYRVKPDELGLFAWHHVTYLISLITGYIIFRPKTSISQSTKPLIVHKDQAIISVTVLLAILAFELAVGIFREAVRPHFVMQMINMVGAIKFVFTIWLMIFAMVHWQDRVVRYTLFVYLAYEILQIFLGNAGRTWVFLHFCAFTMLYHRFVSPIRMRQMVLVFTGMFILFMFFGFYRHSPVDLFQNITNVYFYIGGSNEFTSNLGTAYDLYMRKNALNTLGEIPWQVRFDDIIYLIPSQLLPFEKTDLSNWYLRIIGLHGRSAGFTFGVISQGVVGGGMFELAIRGVITGSVFGLLHKWYLRNNDSFWGTVFYVFVAIKAYYMFRASTVYLPYAILYNFIPAYLLVMFIKKTTTKPKVTS